MPVRSSQDAAPLDPRAFAERAAEQVSRGGALRMGIGDDVLELTGELAASVLAILHYAAAGLNLDISVLPPELTTGQAADLLGVSRPTVVKLIDRGDLVATRVGTHRRVRTTDVIAYRERTRSDSGRELAALTALSQELGQYGDE